MGFKSDDIDQPLGQKKPGKKPLRLRIGAVAFGICVLIVFAGSAAIAFRDRQFRDHEQTMISELRKVEALDSRPATAFRTTVSGSRSSGGPAIIRVDPQEQSAGGGAIVIRDPAVLSQDSNLAHLPDPALIEESGLGPLPIRDSTGRRPLDVYARPWSGAGGARIAIVIGGLGISQTGTQAAITKLPPEVTLAFAPHGNSLHRWMQEARREGHEIVLQVPLEPFGYPQNNPGPHTLLVDAPPDENIENLHWALARVTNYTGVMNYMGARFTSDQEVTSLLMQELSDRGLLFFDDGTSPRSIAKEIASEKGVPFSASDMVIDAEPNRGDILNKLNALERMALARGFAVGSGSALDVTVDTVAAWAGEVRKRGIELVAASAVVSDPERD